MTPTLSKHLYATALLLGMGVLSAQATPQPVGPGSCSSSNCHGAIKPLNSSNILQNEYITWSRHDRHARAYLTLQSADSKKIATNLEIGDPTKAPLCLSCHSMDARAVTSKSDKVRPEDGVSCEACHGPAEMYLKSHAVTGASHAENVANGLTDLSNIHTRATLCLSCHFGTEEKTVNHTLYGAGHPRLTFELDTFGVLQPKHWVVDADYERRKGPYSPARTWLIGQLHHAEAALEALTSPTRSKNGNLPELSLFDCYSCHHTLSEGQWKKRSYGGKPGRLKLNLPALVTVQVTTKTIDPVLGEDLNAQIRALHDSFGKESTQGAIDSLQSTLTTKVAPRLERLTIDKSSGSHILAGLSEYAATTQNLTFELAEQLAMGMQATVASSPELAKPYDAPLKDMFATLRSAEAFKPEAFTRAANAFHRLVSQSQ
jgi:hypothetical protein